MVYAQYFQINASNCLGPEFQEQSVVLLVKFKHYSIMYMFCEFHVKIQCGFIDIMISHLVFAMYMHNIMLRYSTFPSSFRVQTRDLEHESIINGIILKYKCK